MEELRYEDSGIDEKILRAVKEMGFEVMTPIQAQAIPVLLEGKDVIGQAQTGTGKTAAFGIPLLQSVDPEDPKLQAIVLCPTRELAIQAAEEVRRFAKYMHSVKVLPIYGGQDISKQIRSLRGNVQIVIGTPGRVMDHMRRHTLKLDGLHTIVLDEADEMLNMGFKEDIETILEQVPQEHQTALFSATMPKPIMDITRNYQKEDTVLVKVVEKELTIPLVKQYYYEVSRKNKEEVVARLMDYYNPKRSLIFCNTKKMVDELAENLTGRGYFAEGLHGDLSQAQRDRVMAGFRNGTVDILIATDVAARGIDVDDVEAVFNYDIPQDIEYYVHRIGRTGRAGRKGRSFTFVVGREIYKIRDIERVCKTKIKARQVPSAADISAAKSEKILNDILDFGKDNELDSTIKIIERKLDEEDCTAMELAAAFLRKQMGQDLEDIPEEKYIPERRYGKKDFSKKEYGKRDFSKKEYGKKDFSKKDYSKKDKDGKKVFGEKKAYSEKKSFGEKKAYGEKKSFGDKKAYGEKKSFGDKKAYGEKKSFGDKKLYGESFGKKKKKDSK